MPTVQQVFLEDLAGDFRAIAGDKLVNESLVRGTTAPTAAPPEPLKSWLFLNTITQSITHYWNTTTAAWVGLAASAENVIYSKTGANFSNALGEATKNPNQTVLQYLLESPKNALIINLTDPAVSEFLLQTGLDIPALTVSVKSLQGVVTPYTFFDAVPSDLYIVSFPTATSILFESIKESKTFAAENVVYARSSALSLALSESTKNPDQNAGLYILSNPRNTLIANVQDVNSETSLRTLSTIPILTVNVKSTSGTTTTYTGATPIPFGLYAISFPTQTSMLFESIGGSSQFGWTGNLFVGASTYQVDKDASGVFLKAVDGGGEAGVNALSAGDSVAVLYHTDPAGTNQVKTDVNGIELLFQDDKPLLIGGNADVSLPGVAGQVITSQGDSLPPVWANAVSGAITDNAIGTATINLGVGQVQDAIRPINELAAAIPASGTRIVTANGTQHNSLVLLANYSMTGALAQIPTSTALTYFILSADGSFNANPILPVPQYNGQRLLFKNNATFSTTIAITNTYLAAPAALASGGIFSATAVNGRWLREG
jgi:hypothetical protein